MRNILTVLLVLMLWLAASPVQAAEKSVLDQVLERRS